MSSDIFKEICEEDIFKVLEALKQDWPKHFLLYQIITVLREYKKAGSPWRDALYLHGDYNTGVYLHKLIFPLPDRVVTAFYVYTPSYDVASLKTCLETTQLIPWKIGYFYFHMIDTRFSSTIVDTCASMNITCRVSYNTMFWYPHQKEIHANEIPEDVFVNFLDESYAEEMNNNWPHKSPGSDLILAENIRRNFALGLFRKSDKKLLCSALSAFSGGIFVLYTDPDFRGKGYARMIAEHMAREIRKRNRIPFCTVILGNKASETTFTKAGYEVWSKADYIFLKE